ncbi:thiamine pyrophosphate-requiring protein [Halobellus rufus]|uniref:thiamine pyrophosphate-requiring protein n=1 Tax=Halobellus rufus TaxID=1448860 RepID=UPI0009DF1516|nr:thiamine pyrophosphate-requiring protein [Halobellus rufus]
MSPKYPNEEPDRSVPGTATRDDSTTVAAERLLTSLRAHGVSHIFANFGTDHGPLLEAAARLQAAGRGDELPEFVLCPHEFAAMSAAHGYAVATGRPQAVFVHVDVGTQNLGAAMHNAHKGRAPVLLFAGLAPVTDTGYVGSRDNVVQYFQDVFDQPGIVREYCRWTGEYKPPADPDATVVRGLERAIDVPRGPAYVTATREALETPVAVDEGAERSVRNLERLPADDATVDDLTTLVEAAERPVVLTSGYTVESEAAVEDLVAFAEAAGAGVVEQSPTRLCFPRTHELHAGFRPEIAFEFADLVLAVDADIPWTPYKGEPLDSATVVQIDPVPTKPSYPHWDFQFDETVTADPMGTLAAVADRLDSEDAGSAETWREAHRTRRENAAKTLSEHRDADHLTPAILSAAVDEFASENTTVVADATTSTGSVLQHIELTTPGSFLACTGSGLGWGASAAVGVKLAHPEKRVISLVGDGSYVFSNPAACAWLADSHDAPTLTIIYNNGGWNAVSLATLHQHPEGVVSEKGVPGSTFEPRLNLSAPANVVDAYTATVTSRENLKPKLQTAVDAVDSGTPAVLDVHLEQV